MCMKFNEATFQWMVESGNYELLIYKIKNGMVLESSGYTFSSLKKFIEFLLNLNNNNDNYRDSNENTKLLERFYQTNRNELLVADISNNSTLFRNITLLEFSLHVPSLEFLKLIFNNNLNYYNSQDIKQQLTESGLLDMSLKIGDLDIIKFIYRDLKITQFKDPMKSIHYSIMSNNRSRVIEFLLDEIRYVPVHSYTGSFDNHFSNLLLLEYSVFKRLHDLNAPLLVSPSTLKDSIYHFTKLSTKVISFSEYLEFVQCSILSSRIIYSESSDIVNRLSPTLKTIQNLIRYNETGIWVEEQQQKVNDNNNGFFSTLKSLFSNTKNTTATTTNKSIVATEPSSSEGINFKEFNLEREVKRIYIFDFLKNEIVNGNVDILSYIGIKVGFAREFKEYSIIKEMFDQYGSGGTVNAYYKKCIDHVLREARLYSDSNLLIGTLIDENNGKVINETLTIDEILNGNKYSANDLKFQKIEIPLETQIEFLSNIFKYNIHGFYHNKFLLERLFKSKQLLVSDGNNNTRDEYLNEIGKLISNQSKDKMYNSAELFIDNQYVFMYYWNNFKEVFNWSSINIAKSIVSSGDLERIKFIHDNKIGSIGIDSYDDGDGNGKLNDTIIEECLHLDTGRFMHDELGYRFSVMSFAKISKLNGYKSGGLFYYLVDELLKYDKTTTDGNPITYDLHFITLQCDYIQSRYILSKIEKNEMVLDKFTSSGAKIISIFSYIHSFTRVFSLQQVLYTNNFNHIKSFFKHYKNSTDEEKKRFNYNLIDLNISNIKNLKVKQYLEQNQSIFKKISNTNYSY